MGNGEAIRQLVSTPVRAMPTAELPSVELQSVVHPAGHPEFYSLEISCRHCMANGSTKIMTSAAAVVAAPASTAAPADAVTAAA